MLAQVRGSLGLSADLGISGVAGELLCGEHFQLWLSASLRTLLPASLLKSATQEARCQWWRAAQHQFSWAWRVPFSESLIPKTRKSTSWRRSLVCLHSTHKKRLRPSFECFRGMLRSSGHQRTAEHAWDRPKKKWAAEHSWEFTSWQQERIVEAIRDVTHARVVVQEILGAHTPGENLVTDCLRPSRCSHTVPGGKTENECEVFLGRLT